MNIAALDMGSNSFHLLVARVLRDGRIEKLGSRKATLRLGDALAANPDGIIPPEPFAKALETVGEMAAAVDHYRVDRFAAVGTSALRDAKNGPEFVALARARHGVSVEILSGDEEGRLAYQGARAQAPMLPHRVAVLDLGGSSLEIAVGDGQSCFWVESLPLGFLRLGRTLDAAGPVDDARATRVDAHVRVVAKHAAEKLREYAPQAWVLSGGTARGMSALADADDGLLTGGRLRRLAEQVAPLEPAFLQALGVEAARAQSFGLGLRVFASLVDLFDIPRMRISRGGLREGVVLRELRNGLRKSYDSELVGAA